MSWRPRGVRSVSKTAALSLLLLLVVLALRLFIDRGPSVGQIVAEADPQLVERAIDGDTLLLANGHRVRLIGVDTPETKHPDQPVEPLGREASLFVHSLVDGQPVRLEFDRQRLDRYNRLLAYVYLPDGRLLNTELIRAGFSAAQTGFDYRRDMKQRFLAAEQEAREARQGMWRSDAVSTGGRGAD